MTEGSAATRFAEELGHEVRADSWLLQGRSSYALALEALDQGRLEDATALARLTVREGQEARDLYTAWLEHLPVLLVERGVRESSLVGAWAEAAHVKTDLEDGWERYVDLIVDFEQEVHRGGAAADLLERARLTWQAAHDPATDKLVELLALASCELGEGSIGSLWDALLGGYYEALPGKYDPATVPWKRSVVRLALDIFEAVRGHLTGPRRDGEFDVREEDDRWLLEFAPCGSGGRTYPTDGGVGHDPAQFTTEEHDWAWRTKGVCLYCVHCCVLQQREPIERLGIPLRVIQPPVLPTPGDPGRTTCTWSIYKDPSRVPARAYTDVGAVPPPRRDLGLARRER